MEKIKITFLGTGNAVPTPKRNHTAMLLNYKNENILLDCGEGTQRQFKIAKISPSKLTKILITHWHGDHILGLPGLLKTLELSGYRKTMHLYTPKGTKKHAENLIKLFNIKTNLVIHEVHGKFSETDEFYLEASSMNHGTPSNAYSFIIKDKFRLNKAKLKKLKLPNSPLLKKLQQGETISFEGKKIKPSQVSYSEPGRKVTFILDTAPNANAIKISKDADLLICESSFTQQEKIKAKEYKHLTAHDAATIAKKAKVKKLILTHISQRYEHNPKPILNEAKKVFKSVTLANDLDTIEI